MRLRSAHWAFLQIGAARDREHGREGATDLLSMDLGGGPRVGCELHLVLLWFVILCLLHLKLLHGRVHLLEEGRLASILPDRALHINWSGLLLLLRGLAQLVCLDLLHFCTQ